MIIALALGVFIPVLFWFFDFIIKLLGNISTDDIGADLCLFAISFNFSTLFVSFVGTSLNIVSQGYVAVALIALLISLIIYIFILLIITPRRSKKYPAVIQSLRNSSNKKTITVVIGFVTVFAQTIFYVLSF